MNANSDILQYLEQQQGTERPVVVKRKFNDRIFMDVPYIISEENGVYTWTYLTLSDYDYNYRSLVNSIINTKYDISESFAILLNYLDQPEKEEYAAEYKAFQDWRKHAKQYAKEYFDSIAQG